MSRAGDVLNLRVATCVVILALLLIASTATSWARFVVPDRAFEPLEVTGLTGPLGMGGKLVAGLGLLAAGLASIVVFTRGRSFGLTPSRWFAYCAGFFVLAIYFLVRAWTFRDPVPGVVQGSSDTVDFVKDGNLYGLVLALVLASAGALIALVGSFLSRR